jgi:hydroxyacylglutathione hydrolase
MAIDLHPAEVAALSGQATTTSIIDVRSPETFAAGHPQGALSIPFSERRLLERIKLISPATTTAILLAEDSHQSERSAQQIEEEAGMTAIMISGGFTAWTDAGLNVEAIGEIPVNQLQTQLQEIHNLLVLDVREPMEWETGHVPNAILISLNEIAARWRELPQNTPLAVICEGGIRSSTAASMLQSYGLKDLYNVPEGSSGYRQGGYPLEFYEDPD